jgi:hypothetical protein
LRDTIARVDSQEALGEVSHRKEEDCPFNEISQHCGIVDQIRSGWMQRLHVAVMDEQRSDHSVASFDRSYTAARRKPYARRSNDAPPNKKRNTTNEKITMSWIRLHKDEPEYFVIKMGDHSLKLPPKRRDWRLTSLQSGAVLLLAMGALTALVIWLIVSHSQP